MRRQPLTAIAQQAVQKVLRPGDRAIDATVGNGHDTLFLARRVAPGGRVIGFDVQRRAIEGARTSLQAAGLEGIVRLLRCGHEQMLEQIPPDWAGRVGAVMFNLGYLPGGDQGLITQPATTVAALDQAVELLQVGGLISLLVYRGHPGADRELAAVTDWIGRLDRRVRVTHHDSAGPVLYLIEREA
jgi:SAM-dependent methyltransferase